MTENIINRGRAIEYLKWSLIATGVVTILFILIDVFIADGLRGATGLDWLVKFLKLGYSYFVSALVTSVLTILLQALIAKNGDHIGVNDEYTPYFLLGLLGYLVFYFIYLKHFNLLWVGIAYLICSIAFVYLLVHLWVDNISTNIEENSRNMPM